MAEVLKSLSPDGTSIELRHGHTSRLPEASSVTWIPKLK